jgi:hypothetical protein
MQLEDYGFCPIGEGVVDITEVLMALDTIGYDAFATIEQDRVPGTGAPKNGSLAQSAVGLIVIVAYAVAGWDPLVQLFFWGGSGGGLGVLLLITLTGFAVIGYFARNPEGEDVLHRIVAPVVSTVLLLVVSYLALDNIATLLGVEPGSTPAIVVPALFGVVLVLGVIWGLYLRGSRPQVYSGIGLGARSATTGGGFAAALNETTDPADGGYRR